MSKQRCRGSHQPEAWRRNAIDETEKTLHEVGGVAGVAPKTYIYTSLYLYRERKKEYTIQQKIVSLFLRATSIYVYNSRSVEFNQLIYIQVR